MIQELAMLVVFILPAYLANAAPVLLGGLYPIDSGKLAWDKKPIFGKSKTWLGLFGGFFAGMLGAMLLGHILRGGDLDLFGGQGMLYVQWGALLSAGALAGDLLGSFVKRRLGFMPGQPTFLWDQLTFIVIALIAALPLGISTIYQPLYLAIVLCGTYVVHRMANLFAHAWGIKRVPW